MNTTEYSLKFGDSLLGAQMLFVAFGALVLVPILTGLDPNVALFTAGGGTLIFQLITRGKVPVFLASSFAFIAPIIYGVQTWGIPATLCGLTAAGVLYIALSFLVRTFGQEILHRAFVNRDVAWIQSKLHTAFLAGAVAPANVLENRSGGCTVRFLLVQFKTPGIYCSS